MFARHPSLLARANRLLVLVGLVAAVLAMGATWLAWQSMVNAYIQRDVEQTLRHYQAKWADHQQEWRKSVARQKAQIEFLRIGELSGEQRLVRLRAFFNAQAENREFAAVMLLDSAGTPLFSLGCQGMPLNRTSLSATYLMNPCGNDKFVFAVSRAPLWLGDQGRGLVLFTHALDNAMLLQLARDTDTLYLRYKGRTVASSLGEKGLLTPIDPLFNGHIVAGDRLQVSLPLAENGQFEAPVLVIQRPMNALISPVGAVAGAALLTFALLTLIWFGLGRSMRSHIARIDALGHAADTFLVEFRRSAPVAASMDRLRARNDEIGRLSAAMNRLMEEAQSRYAEQAAYLQTLDLLEEAVVELDTLGRIIRVSSGWRKVTGIDARVDGQMLADYMDPEDSPALVALIAALASREKQQATARLRLNRRGDDEHWLELRLARGDMGSDMGTDMATDMGRDVDDGTRSPSLRGVLRDITQGYLQERRITHMALHDALTGLPNRILLEDRLKIALRMAARSQHKVALGFIDLDHFKHINDSLGHKTGDQLLIALAQRLRGCLRGGDTLARWGGDEFVVLLPDMPGVSGIREVTEKLRQAMATPLQVEENEFNLTFSAGFAVYPDDAETGDLLLAHADRAMFYAKAQGRNNLQFFSDMSHKGLGKKEIYIQQRLATAIREKRITNHYQPLVHAKTGHIVGVETLARWFEADIGWISPATFIPMAENLGLIRELGEQVWHQALHAMQSWRQHNFGLSVNISRRQLFLPFFTEKLLEDTAAHGLEPGRITLEITESMALLDVEYAAERLDELRKAGFRLSIDDFGTGYSSLSQLHDLPVHELKIDIAFVRRIEQAQGARLIQTIVSMAEILDLETVAEGVENEIVAQRLTAMGVDILQGWHLGRPMPADALTEWLANKAAGSAPQ